MRLYGELPGGLLTQEGVRRDYAFRAADGRLELCLAEICASAECMPRAVTHALLASLEYLGGLTPDAAMIDSLCVADRQYLMRELGRLLGHEGGWYSATCNLCRARFDFRLDLAELPVKPAGEGYPHARVRIGGHELILRLPCGADQLRLLGLPTEQRLSALVRALIVGTDGEGPELGWFERLDETSIDMIDAALEAVSPAVVLQVAATCPECGAHNAVALDPYGVLARGDAQLLDEVHRIAWHYHWSESQILSLPRARRQRYLRLIDAERGMVQ
ncbi:MAG: hypothetical protein RMK60_06660 [Burkholderiales bacterium]|nr:hypothetical protein [Burkholderiales bacterium]